MREPPHPLPYITAQCRSAGLIWIALVEWANARETGRIAPTLSELSDITGVPRRTVSSALWVLEQARWISRKDTPIYKDGRRIATKMRLRLRRPWRLWKRKESKND